MIQVSQYLFTSMHIYTLKVCTDGVTTYMCPCVPLAARSSGYHWVNAYTDIMLICADIDIATDVFTSMPA